MNPRHIALCPGHILPATVVALALTGCGGRDGGGQARLEDQLTPPVAPMPPAARDVPLDEELVARAQQTVQASAAPDVQVQRRANAIEAAEHLPREQALALLGEALADAEPRLRFAAAMAAGRLRLAKLKPQLEALVDGPSFNVRVAALCALHRLGDTSRTHLLQEYATSADPILRANTAVALGLLDEPTAVRVLKPMQADPDPNVRLNAAEALWRLRDEAGFEALLAASISNYTDDRVIGTLGLGNAADPRSQAALLGKLTDEYAEVRLAAARGLGRLGSDRGYAVAAAHLDDADPRRRAMAALALGEIGRLDAQPRIRPLLEDRDPAVRLAAATAVLQIADHAGASGQTAGGRSES